MALPQHHLDNITSELRKPKSQQKISEDFYIEMERALTTVANYMPIAIPNGNRREEVRQVLLDKYRDGTIDNIVDFRKLAKIARAARIEADTKQAAKALQRIFSRNSFSINEGYETSVSLAYRERDLLLHLQAVIADLELFDAAALDADLEGALKRLVEVARLLLGDRR